MNKEKTFKPDLIPNNPKDDSLNMDAIILKNGGYDRYSINFKKDGCRLQLIDGKVLTRSLKIPGSKIVVDRFQALADKCKELNISLDGEFYMHGLKFNSIFRFFSKSDVTTPEYKKKLEKEKAKNLEKFKDDYDGLEIEFLTTFHIDLKFHLFDGIILDAHEDIGHEKRMKEIFKKLSPFAEEFGDIIALPGMLTVKTKEGLDGMYDLALKNNYEGLVLTHKNHKYKFGRNTLKQGTILKMKDDKIEYDGVVLDVLEGTKAKDGTEKTVNELGRSVTSKKKADREKSGLASGFLVEYEDIGTFKVSLNGFDNEEKAELLGNKGKYIGKHLKYTGMKPVKDFPRSAYFKCWRDEK